MGSFSQLPQNLQSLQGAVTNAGQTEQPKYGQPQMFDSKPQQHAVQQPTPIELDQPRTAVLPQEPQSNAMPSAYPNTINQWDNSPQSPIRTLGKGSSTASSKLPSPLTNNSPFGGSGKGA